ncbi:hypothetical protein Cni_G23988 [Canna indica]|uniref:Uncharacterized protein n=1 Tax=Canna indica TaxID=4628 RepID=A0AAQ3KU43_9LILI|nr:hypothetical protein Cni_G23988 [Canna indica]
MNYHGPNHSCTQRRKSTWQIFLSESPIMQAQARKRWKVNHATTSLFFSPNAYLLGTHASCCMALVRSIPTNLHSIYICQNPPLVLQTISFLDFILILLPFALFKKHGQLIPDSCFPPRRRCHCSVGQLPVGRGDNLGRRQGEDTGQRQSSPAGTRQGIRLRLPVKARVPVRKVRHQDEAGARQLRRHRNHLLFVLAGTHARRDRLRVPRQRKRTALRAAHECVLSGEGRQGATVLSLV